MNVDLAPEASEKPIVRVPCALTFDEYRVAIRFLSRRKGGWLSRRGGMAFLVFIMIAVVMQFVNEGVGKVSWDGWLCSSVFLILFIYCLLAPLRQRWRTSRLWNANPALAFPTEFVFTPSRFQANRADSAIALSWKNFVGAESFGGIAFLKAPGNVTYLVPIRAFTSVTDLRTFQQFVEGMVPKSKLKIG
jgi:hypothetical protein